MKEHACVSSSLRVSACCLGFCVMCLSVGVSVKNEAIHLMPAPA